MRKCSGCGGSLYLNRQGLWSCRAVACRGYIPSQPGPRVKANCGHPGCGDYVCQAFCPRIDPIRRDPLWMIVLSKVLGRFMKGL